MHVHGRLNLQGFLLVSIQSRLWTTSVFSTRMEATLNINAIAAGANEQMCSSDGLTGIFASCLLASQASAIKSDVNSSLALRFLGPSTPSAQQLVALLGNTTATAGMAPIQWSLIDQTVMMAELGKDAATGSSYHAYLLPGQFMGDAVNTGRVQDLTALNLLSPSALSWPSFLPIYHDLSAGFGGNIYSIPVHGSMWVLYYRRDVFAAAGRPPPRTWADTLAAAAAFNGSDLDGDGAANGDWGICMWQHLKCAAAGTPISAVLASMVQSTGWNSALYFQDAASTRSVVMTPAWKAALEVLRNLARYAPPPPSKLFPDADCAYQPLFSSGRCAMAISIAGQFKSDSWGGGGSAVRGKVGAVMMPGSEEVLDWAEDCMLPCDTKRCPYAVSYNDDSANGGRDQRLVNHAPYAGGTGPVMFINNRYSEAERLATFYIISKAVTPTNIWPLVVSPATFHGPTRREHLDDAALPYWQSYNYHPTDLDSFLDATRRSLYSSNIATDLRSVGSFQWATFLMSTAHLLTRGLPSAEPPELDQVVETSRALFNASFPKELLQKMRLSYTVSISKQSFDTEPVKLGSSGGHALNRTMLLVIVVVIAMAVLAFAAVVWRWRRWPSQNSVQRGIAAPGACRHTTLVVTDIQDSTRLWECLPACVMDLALQLHHGTIRRCATAVGGYESATEGDSFILAFRHPAAALLFALTVQDELLTVAWPEELLEDPVCQSVWASAPARPAKPHRGTAGSVRSTSLGSPRLPTHIPEAAPVFFNSGPFQTSGSTAQHDTALYAIRHSAPLPQLNPTTIHPHSSSQQRAYPTDLCRTAAGSALDTQVVFGRGTPRSTVVAAPTATSHLVALLPAQLPNEAQNTSPHQPTPSHFLLPVSDQAPPPQMRHRPTALTIDVPGPVSQTSTHRLSSRPSLLGSPPRRRVTVSSAVGPEERNPADEGSTHASPTHGVHAAIKSALHISMAAEQPSMLSFSTVDVSFRPRRCSTAALPYSLSLTALRKVPSNDGGGESNALADLPETAQPLKTTSSCGDGIVIGAEADGDPHDSADVSAFSLLQVQPISLDARSAAGGQSALTTPSQIDSPRVIDNQSVTPLQYYNKRGLPAAGNSSTTTMPPSAWQLRATRRTALLTSADNNADSNQSSIHPKLETPMGSVAAVPRCGLLSVSSGILQKHNHCRAGRLCRATLQDVPGGPSSTAEQANIDDSRKGAAGGGGAASCVQDVLELKKESVAAQEGSARGGLERREDRWGTWGIQALIRAAGWARRPEEGVSDTDCCTGEEIMVVQDEDEQQDGASQRLRFVVSGGESGGSAWEEASGDTGTGSGMLTGGGDILGSRYFVDLQLAMQERPPPPANEPAIWRHILQDMWRRHSLQKEHQHQMRPRHMLPRRMAPAHKKGGKPPRRVLLLRGLRVRMGLHSGVLSEADVAYSRRMTRTLYSGVPMATAKAVASAAAGGMVVLSADTHALLTAAGAAGRGSGAEFPAALNATQSKDGPMLLLPKLSSTCTNTPQRVVFWHGGVHVLDEHLPPLEVYMAATPAQVARWAVLPPPAEGGKGKRVAAGVLHAPVGQLAVATVAVSGAGFIAAWNHDVWCQSACLLWREAAQLATDLDGFLATPRSAMMHPSPASTQPPPMSAQQQLQQLFLSRMARHSLSGSRAASNRGAGGVGAGGGLDSSGPSSSLLVAVFRTSTAALRWAGGLLAHGMLAPWPPALLLHEHGGEVWKPRTPPPPPPSPSFPPPGPRTSPTHHGQLPQPLPLPSTSQLPSQSTGTEAAITSFGCMGSLNDRASLYSSSSNIMIAIGSLGGLDTKQQPMSAHTDVSKVTIGVLTAASTHLKGLPGAGRPDSPRRHRKERKHALRTTASGATPEVDSIQSTTELMLQLRGNTSHDTAGSPASVSPPRSCKAVSVPETNLASIAPTITPATPHTGQAAGPLRARRGLNMLSCGTRVATHAPSAARSAAAEVMIDLGEPEGLEGKSGAGRQQEAARAGLGRARRDLMEAISRRNAMRPLTPPSIQQRKPWESYLFQRSHTPSNDDVVRSTGLYMSGGASTGGIGGGSPGGAYAQPQPAGSAVQQRACYGYDRSPSSRHGSSGVMPGSATISLGVLGDPASVAAAVAAAELPGVCALDGPVRAMPLMPDPVCDDSATSPMGCVAVEACSGGICAPTSACNPQDSPLRSPLLPAELPYQFVDDIIQTSPGELGCGQPPSCSGQQGLCCPCCSHSGRGYLVGSGGQEAESWPDCRERARTMPSIRPIHAQLSSKQLQGTDGSVGSSGVPCDAWGAARQCARCGSNTAGGFVPADGDEDQLSVPVIGDGGERAGVGAHAPASNSQDASHRLMHIIHSGLQSTGTDALTQFSTTVCPSVVPEALALELLAASGPVPALPVWRAAAILRSRELSDMWLTRTLGPARPSGLSVYRVSGAGSATASAAVPVTREGLSYCSTGYSDEQPTAITKSDTGNQQSSGLSASALALLLPSSCSHRQQHNNGALQERQQDQDLCRMGQQEKADWFAYSTGAVLPSRCTDPGGWSTWRSNTFAGQGLRQAPTLSPQPSVLGMPRSVGDTQVVFVPEQTEAHAIKEAVHSIDKVASRPRGGSQAGKAVKCGRCSGEQYPPAAMASARRRLALPLELLEQLAARGLRLRAGVAEGMTTVQINAISGNAQYTGPAAVLATSLALAAAPGTVLVSATAAAAAAATLAERSVPKGNATFPTPERATSLCTYTSAGKHSGAKACGLQQTFVDDRAKPARFDGRAGLEERTRAWYSCLTALGLHPAIAARIRLQSE